MNISNDLLIILVMVRMLQHEHVMGGNGFRVPGLGLYLYTAAQGVVAQLIPHCCGWAVELKLSLTMSVLALDLTRSRRRR